MLKLYIIYGRNLSKERMYNLCQTANPMAVATLKDYQLVFQGRTHGAHANVIPAKGQEVPVVIWELSEEDEIRMDVDQGIGYGRCTKECVDIEVNGETLQAQIYIQTPGPYGTPSDRYLQNMVKGYREFNLPARVLNEALIHAYENTVTNGTAVMRPAQ